MNLSGLIKETYPSLPRGWEGQQLSSRESDVGLGRAKGALPFHAWHQEDKDPVHEESRA